MRQSRLAGLDLKFELRFKLLRQPSNKGDTLRDSEVLFIALTEQNVTKTKYLRMSITFSKQNYPVFPIPFAIPVTDEAIKKEREEQMSYVRAKVVTAFTH